MFTNSLNSIRAASVQSKATVRRRLAMVSLAALLFQPVSPGIAWAKTPAQPDQPAPAAVEKTQKTNGRQTAKHLKAAPDFASPEKNAAKNQATGHKTQTAVPAASVQPQPSEPSQLKLAVSLPKEVLSGTEVTADITWSNISNRPVSGLVLEAPLPDGTTVGAITGNGAFDPVTRRISWTVNSQPTAASGKASATLKVSNPFKAGDAFEFTVTGREQSSLIASASARTTVRPVAPPAIQPVKSSPSIDAALTAPPIVKSGATFSYAINWSANNAALSDDASLVLKLDPALTLVTATGSARETGNVISWNLGTPPTGSKSDTGSETVVVAVDPSSAIGAGLTTIGQLCSGSLTAADCVQLSATTRIEDGPTLALEKTVNRASAKPGAALTYTLNWSIEGTGTAMNVALTDPLPKELTFASISAGGNYDPVTRTVTWSLGDRDSGESGTVQWTAEITAPLADQTVITNTATASATGLNPVSASATTAVTSQSTLKLIKTVSQATAAPGKTLVYTLRWSVAGTEPLAGVSLSDTLLTSLKYVKSSTGGVYDPASRTVHWAIGRALPGDSGTTTVTVTVADTTTMPSTIKNTGVLSAQNAPSATGSASITVAGTPELVLTKTINHKTAEPGETLVYTLIIKNTGIADATHVRVTDALPAGFAFFENGGRNKEFAVGTLAPDTSRTITYGVIVSTKTKPGTYSNTATAFSDQLSPVVATAKATIKSFTAVAQTNKPIVAITKAANRQTVLAGGIVSYTITIKNTGLAPAYNVRITDTLPSGLAFIDRTGQSATWRIGDLLPGHARVLDYEARVASDAAAGSAINTATVSGDNVAALSASAAVTVQRGQVLGALATTGPGPADYSIVVAALASLTAGYALVRRRNRRALTIRA